MRRRKVEAPPDTGVRPGFRVERVRRHGARRLAVVGPAHWVWEDGDFGPHLLGEKRKGELVKLQPPASAFADRVEAVRAAFVAAGAAAVRVLPSPCAAPAPQAPVPAARRGLREVVEACAAEARTADREALDGVLDEALTGEGL